MIWHHESYRVRATEPHLVFFDEAENLFVNDRVVVPDDEELLPALDKLRHILPEKRKWRVCDDDVGLFQ
jgi:hypothetical protein